jgi:hypothetical protein
MNSKKSNNIDPNTKLMTTQELKEKLEKINNSFCNYIKSLNQNFDETPEHLNISMKNSNILLDEFKNFYDQFNLLTEKVLNTNNSNKEKNTTGQKKTIIVENVIVKQLKRSIKTSIDNLKIKNDENNNAIKKYDNELKSLFPKSNKNN